MWVFTNPVKEINELPLNSFYRYVIASTPKFSRDGAVLPSAMYSLSLSLSLSLTRSSGGVTHWSSHCARATFGNLPKSTLMTLALDTPEAWVVQPTISRHDLDNIRLADISDPTVYAQFRLEHIIIQGGCFDASAHSPVPGLELVIGTVSEPDIHDTTVMANLGYYQLKAKPGVWLLRLADGRASWLYENVDGSSHKVVEISNYYAPYIAWPVRKQPGKQHYRLLELTDKQIYGNEVAPRTEQQDDVIHIFSMASGHLYERFLKVRSHRYICNERNEGTSAALLTCLTRS